MEQKSALRKLLDLGLMLTHGEGWRIHPLDPNVYLIEMNDGRAILSDGERRVEYPSFQEALDTTFTRRALQYGTSLERPRKGFALKRSGS